ncbi:MAG: hypothetical protein H6807_12895 [Planctomycetes bacterium]|nr:hypothetical protein [Planctomycetota bacterium]
MARPVLILAERRLGRLSLFFMIALVVMIGRLVQLQFVEASHYEGLVAQARVFAEPIAAHRGAILDRQGRMLAERVERYQITVLPTAFREANRIDALQDLVAAFLPELLPAGFAAPEIGLARQAEAREARFRAVYALREEAVQRLLALRARDLRLDRDHLMARLERLRYPAGELILPPSKLPARIETALLLLADNEVCGSLRSLRLRLAGGQSLGEVLATTPERVIAGIEREFLDLNRLAHDVLPEDPRSFWAKLFSQELRNVARMERGVRRDLDDQILKVELGSHDLARGLATAERAALAAELGLETRSRAALAARLLPYLKEGRGGLLPAEERERFELVDEIIDGRPLAEEAGAKALAGFEDYEIRSLAGILEVWDDDPGRIGRAYAERVRGAADFALRKADYLSPEKEWARIVQHRDGVPYELFDGCSFEVANRVWESFGLREIGLGVRASEGRRYWEDERGVATTLVGRCNRSGKPLGGLELLLYQGGESLLRDEGPGVAGEEDDEEGAVDQGPGGVLRGKSGKLLRRRELDRSYTTLERSEPPRHGLDVRLTIDRDFQAKAEEIVAELAAELGAAGGASATVIDLETGDILLLASAPRVRGIDYLDRYLAEDATRRERAALGSARRDGAISREDWRRRDAELRDRLEELSLHDRAFAAGTTSQSPPGSVLKPIAAIGMLQDGVFGVGEEIYDKHKGVVDVWRAIEVSSNAFFWEGARRWGVGPLVDWYARFGLCRPIPLLIDHEDAAARLRSLRGDAAKNVVIGQGSMSLSTLEVAAMMANLARRGRVIEPRIVLAIDDRRQPVVTGERIPVDEAIAERVFDAMEKVAAKAIGGAEAARLGIAGKTGTAELGGRHDGLYNAWFAGFAPRERPRIAFAVVAERTHSMGKTSAPFAARIVDLVLGGGS